MSADTIPARSPGQVIQAAHMNLLRSVFTQVLYGRNSSGVVADLAGDLGSSTFRWNDMSINRILLGASAAGIQFVETGSELLIKVNNTTVCTIGTAGLDGAGIENATIALAKMATGVLGLQREVFNSNGTFTSAASVNRVLLFGCGGGGGGAGGESSTGGAGAGGNGGNGANARLTLISVSPSTGYAVTRGAGGTAGAGGLAGVSAATSGGAGGATDFGGSVIFGGAAGGLVGGHGATTNTAQNTTILTGHYRSQDVVGGVGGRGAAGAAGSAGGDTHTAQSGSGAASGSPDGGGGGGGGAGFQNAGGNGGAGTNGSGGAAGAAGAANSGAGGGGGGGAASGDGGAGGAGGSGFLWVMYVKES